MIPASIAETAPLANGVLMPWLGLGVFKTPEGEDVKSAVGSALETGYRLIDTAAMYRNETGVGEALKRSGVPRESVFITTKVWNSDQGYDQTLRAFEHSRQRLGLSYLDLYLIHWPVAGKYRETWKALETLYADGQVRAIGVSNFTIRHLEDLLSVAKVAPMVNQVECHPFLSQKPLQQFCRDHAIQMEAWAPLIQGRLDQPLLVELARHYGKTPAQIILRWHLQHERVIIPKSVHAERIRENANLFDFVLSTEDMERVDAMNRDQRFGPDPDHFNF